VLGVREEGLTVRSIRRLNSGRKRRPRPPFDFEEGAKIPPASGAGRNGISRFTLVPPTPRIPPCRKHLVLFGLYRILWPRHHV